MDPQAQLKMEAERLKILETRLSQPEKDKLFAFCQDKAMVLALEKALLYGIHMMGTITPEDKDLLEVNWAFFAFNGSTKDEDLGRALRAKIEGLTFLSDSFKQIKKFGDKPIELVEAKNVAL